MRATFFHFVRDKIPFHQRLPKRLAWLRVCMSKFDEVMDFITSYRKAAIYEANVTAEVMSLQNWLNVKLDATNRSIRIVHENDVAVEIGLESEGEGNALYVGLEEENISVYIGLISEYGALATDFAVQIPATVGKDTVISTIEQYRPIGKSYSIIIKN